MTRHRVRVTPEAARALLETADHPWTPRPVEADGMCVIELEPQTLERLEEHQMLGESTSDVIIRLAAFRRAHGRMN